MMTEQSPRSFPTVPVVACIVALIVGLAVGITLGKTVFESEGIPESCARAIERADTAITLGESIADNGEAAFEAIESVRLGEAVDALTTIRADAETLLDEVQAFNNDRQQCRADRSD